MAAALVLLVIVGLWPSPSAPSLSDEAIRALLHGGESEENEGVGEDDPGAALRFRTLQLQSDDGTIRADGLLNAIEQAKSLQATSAAKAGVTESVAGLEPGGWTWLGPGNVGGRTRAIAIHPTTPNTIWAAGISGGIWKTTNGLAAMPTWQPLDDFMANLRVSTLVVDPSNPDVLYAGTGESDWFTNHNPDDSGFRGAGVFKTTDGGTTWNHVAATTGLDWRYVNRLDLDPNDSKVILAATNSGIWRTADRGGTWDRTLSARTNDIEFHPTDSNKAVAGGGHGSAWYSEDGGRNWTPATGLPTTPTNENGGRVEIAYARSAPGTVYASLHVNDGEIWRSTNGGANYSKRSTAAYLGGQGWYDNALWVDPTNPNILIVGGVELWRSTSGGTSLSQISDGGDEQVFDTSAHADHHAIVEHPQFNGTTQKTVFFGNDGGIYRTSDVYTVALNSGWTELNNNYGVTQFYSGAGHAASGRIIGGTQDNGTPSYTGGTQTWGRVFGGDGGDVAIDPTDSNYLYGEYIHLRLFRSSPAGTNYISGGLSSVDPNGGCTKNAPYRIPDACAKSANFIAPFVLDPNDSDRLLAGGVSLWRSNDARAPNTTSTGPQWASIKGPTLFSTPISAIAVAKGNSNIIWVGHNTGLIYRTVDGQLAAPSWLSRNVAGMPGRMVLDLEIDPRNSNIVYATFGGFSANNVWRTDDGGTTWSPRTGTAPGKLPDAPVRSLLVHPTNSNFLYAGTEVGVFASEDAGATWSAVNDGPANVSVDELFWFGVTNLVAATHGRGMYKTDVSTVRPANDRFANAFVLTGTTANRTGDTNVSATREPHEPNHHDNPGGASVWYRWTAPAAGPVTIDTATSPFDSVLAVYTGTAVDALTKIVSNDDEVPGSIRTSKVTFPAVAGTEYRIVVDGFKETGAVPTGTINLHLSQVTTSHQLTVTKQGTGSGVVTSAPVGINCGATCSAAFGVGTVVTLTAAPAAGSTFAGWGGACTGTALTCVVTMNTVTAVTATFNTSAVTHTLTVTKSGTGSGTVTSAPAGIDCGAVCQFAFPENTLVTLTAAAAGGSAFTGWGGACTGTQSTCTLTMNAAKAASAAFAVVGGVNNAFASAIELTGVSGQRTGDSNVDATKEAGEPNHAGNAGGASVWYRLTPTQSASLTITLADSGFDTLLGVYTGTAVGALTQVASNDDENFNGGILTSKVTFPAAAGTTYRIAVDGYNNPQDAAGPVTGAVKIAWNLDADVAPPVNPTLSSPTHTAGTWSALNTVQVSWAGASDAQSGVDGFSYLFNTAPTTTPDETKDAEESATGAFSGPLTDGDHYFHLRTRDNVGNWSAPVHLGPFRIDTLVPLDPVVASTSHVPGAASSDGTVDVTFTGASDLASGVDGYSYLFDASPLTLPDETKDAEEGAAGTTSAELAPGSYYFHLRTRDNAGNWTTTVHVGPFVIVDLTAPTNPTLASVSHTPGAWSASNVVWIVWSADDGQSGLDGFSYLFDTFATTSPDEIKDAEEATDIAGAQLADGEHYFHLRARDNAGNWSAPVHLGPFRIDTVLPLDPSVSSTSHIPGVASSDATVDLSFAGAADAGSGVDGFSYAFDTSPFSLPDQTKDAEESAVGITSPILGPGSSYYFHLRTRDNAGNWTATVHAGPFVIVPPPDATAPNNPAVASTTHAVGAWSAAPVVNVRLVGASDAASGVDGFSYLFDEAPTTSPDETKDAEEGATDIAGGPLPHGAYYFHLRTRDNAGNWSAPAHLGPFYVDAIAPIDPSVRSTSHRPNAGLADSTIDMSWIGASDAGSGVDGFSYSWDTNATTVPDAVKDAEEWSTGTTSPSFAPGSYYFHLRTRDNVGHWTATVHVGPFGIVKRTVAETWCRVPRLRGLTLAGARAKLRTATCTLGAVTRAYSPRVRRGRIVSQRPAPGTRLRKNAKVSVLVSRGPRPKRR